MDILGPHEKGPAVAGSGHDHIPIGLARSAGSIRVQMTGASLEGERHVRLVDPQECGVTL